LRIVIIQRNRLSEHQGFPFTWVLADAIVGISAGIAADLEATAGFRGVPVLVIPDPMIASDFDALSAEPVVHPFFEGAAIPVFVAVEKLEAPKDPETLITAFAWFLSRRKGRPIVIGDGALLPQVGIGQCTMQRRLRRDGTRSS
jgi:hypothetical protein